MLLVICILLEMLVCPFIIGWNTNGYGLVAFLFYIGVINYRRYLDGS